jgi:hypothetical protein
MSQLVFTKKYKCPLYTLMKGQTTLIRVFSADYIISKKTKKYGKIYSRFIKDR